ncbi:MAG: hypothetical protein R2725_03245 [Solirubrobacterales bacterium]
MRAAGALLTAGLLLALAPSANAERGADGDVLGFFDARLNPQLLPRTEPAPIGVHVAGDFEDESGDSEQLPQLLQIRVAINRKGRLFDRGLPVCTKRWIEVATTADARRACHRAAIGRGHVDVRVKIAGEPGFPVKAKLLVFNGPRRDGRRLIYAHAYAPNPPGSFVLTFRITRRSTGTFGTVLTTALPRRARKWAYLTHFDMTLRRTYEYRGRRRSYASAACAAPAGFSSAVFPFARAAYRFADGTRVQIPVSRSCRVKGP